MILDRDWLVFEQLALRLQRHGARVVHVDMQPRRLRCVRYRLWFRERRRCDTGDLAREFRDIGAQDIVDILCPESALQDALAAALEAGLSPNVISDLRRRTIWGDKLRWSQELSGSRFFVPETQSLSDPFPLPLGRSSLPVVVKPRTGSGGAAVTLVTSLGQLRHVVSQLDNPGDFVVQRAIAGDVYQYVAAYREGELLLDSVYVATTRSNQKYGPGSEAIIVQEPELKEVGRALLRRIGGRGLANIETLRDADGRHWIIDINLRPWGMCCAYRRAGYYFDDAYFRSLSGGPSGEVPLESCHVGQQVSLFPVASRVLLSTDPWRALRHFQLSLPSAIKDFGASYAGWYVISFLGHFLLHRHPGSDLHRSRKG